MVREGLTEFVCVCVCVYVHDELGCMSVCLCVCMSTMSWSVWVCVCVCVYVHDELECMSVCLCVCVCVHDELGCMSAHLEDRGSQQIRLCLAPSAVCLIHPNPKPIKHTLLQLNTYHTHTHTPTHNILICNIQEQGLLELLLQFYRIQMHSVVKCFNVHIKSQHKMNLVLYCKIHILNG